MIRVTTGEFKLDDYKLIIHSELTLTEFRKGDIPITATVFEKKHSGVYCFAGVIDGMRSKFQIEFGGERLDKMRFAEDVIVSDRKIVDEALALAAKSGHEAYVAELKKWTTITDQAQRKQMDRHDAWLEKVIGAPPPYEYDSWGEIVSMIEPRYGDVEILVRFRYDFGETPDLKAYFENRREREHRQAMNPPKPFVPGQLPPGFSRKM